MRIRILVVAVVASLVAALPGQAALAVTDDEAQPPEEWRSFWVDAFNEGIYTPEQVDTLVADAVAANANALIVQTARRQDCFCNDASYPRTDTALAPVPYDPLAEIVTDAHAAGLEVHAWVNVGTMWNSATPHSSPEHVFNAHGPSATGSDRWLNKRLDGVELVGTNSYMDLGNPAVVDYIVEGASSIARNYDVDGINLDYVRYPDFNSAIGQNDWGYSEVSLARFQAATGRTDVPAPADEQFSDWRRDQVTNLVRKLFLSLYEIDRTVRLSNDAITYSYGPQTFGGWENTRPYAEVLQDWKGWLEEGILDTAVAMNYKRNWLPDQAQMFDEWTEVISDWQGDRHAVNGPALYLNEIDDSLAQIADIRTPTAAGNTAAGWSGYSYANPTLTGLNQSAEVRAAERAALTAALTEGADAPFAEPAAVPEMTWKTAPTLGHVTGSLVLRDGTALDQADVSLQPLGPPDGRAPKEALTDGSGWFGFVDVEPGRYLVRVTLPDGVVGQPVTLVRVSAGAVTDAELRPYIAVP